jgi:dephospho-CoA kinase
MLIGLTGGIACGKSAANKEFKRLGCQVIDVDEIVKSQVLVDGEVLDAAMERWGSSVVILGDAGARVLNRARVAEVIFGDEVERKWWEGLVHPRVSGIWRSRVDGDRNALWVVEIPLLFEAGLEKGFDFVVCVGANPIVQLERAMARGMTRAQADQRIASQLPLDSKISSAHAILWNDGDLAFLSAQVAGLVAMFRARN